MAVHETWLRNEAAANRLLPVKFAQQLFLLDGRGILYCPARDALVVSDLHFEKASFLSQFANPLPQLDTLSTLKRLQAVLTDYQPRQVVCLGDSFHDADGFFRMPVAEQTLLSSLVEQCESWLWVLGNHDPEIPAEAGGKCVHRYNWDSLILAHEPEEGRTEPQLIGHFHPKVRVSVSRKRYAGKCFVHDRHRFIMPAFGQYTGGLDIQSAPMTALFNRRQVTCFLLYEGHIYKV